MKKKWKVELAADALLLITLMGSCNKVLNLVKEQREGQVINTKPSIYGSIDEENSNTNFTIIDETLAEQNTTLGTTIETTKENSESQEESTYQKEVEKTEVTEETINQQATAQTEATTMPDWTEEIIEVPEPVDKNIMKIATSTSGLNVRANNTTDALRIGNLQINEKVYVLFSCENNWDLVKYNDHIGYVCRDYLNYTGEEVESDYSYTPIKDIALTKSGLNFRPTPSTEVKSISRFSKDDEIELIAEVDNGWYLVRNNGKLGYVHGDYIISLLDRANEQYSELSLTNLEVQKVIYATDNITIRNGASEESDEIGNLEELETVRVIKEYGDWYFVMTNDYNFGFLNKENTKEQTGRFMVSDLSEQRVWLYNNKELYYTTYETTGKDSTPSHIGKTTVNSKESPKFLSGTGYTEQRVEYWVGINDYEEGFHDSYWRSIYGKDANYHLYGSHGCHNTPLEPMKGIYEHVEIGDTVIVHR